MDVKTSRRLTVHKRVEAEYRASNKVCVFWLQGRCSKNPCRFMHREEPDQQPKRSRVVYDDPLHLSQLKFTWKNPNYPQSKNAMVSTTGKPCVGNKNGQRAEKRNVPNRVVSEAKNAAVSTTKKAVVVKKSDEVTGQKNLLNEVVSETKRTPKVLCESWAKGGTCINGEKCHSLHSWSCGEGFSLLAKLEGHQKAVTGIVLPSGSDKLYSASEDLSVRILDCHTGQCVGVVNFESEVRILISEGPWIFGGIQDTVKAWNTQTSSELMLNGPGGLVHSMVGDDDTLFVGTEDGTILAWKLSSESGCFEIFSLLKGHTSAVISLVVGFKRLYSGSMDQTIRAWNNETLECVHVLEGHTDAITSLICWDIYLLSASLDKTLKIWGETDTGNNLEVVYEHKEEHGFLALSGINDADTKPILLCSCTDNIVRLYDLPSFTERGRIFARREVRSVRTGTGGLFFTGGETGEVFAWKLQGDVIDSAVAS